MASSIQEFRARTQRDIMLPSGLSVRIRLIDCMAFLGLGELPIPAADDGAGNGQPPTAERLMLNQRYIDRAISMGAVDPLFSDRAEDVGREDMLHVSELRYGDRLALGHAVMELAGLSTEAAEQVQSFRADAIGANGAGAGAAVPQITP